MPGSKTFTSTTNLELLEASIADEIKEMNKTSVISAAKRGVVEVAKICSSVALSAYYTLNDGMLTRIKELSITGLTEELTKLIFTACAVFFVGYSIISFILLCIRFFLNALFNSRMLKQRKIRAKHTFYHISVNTIMLAISFENKSSAYHNRKMLKTSPEFAVTTDLEIQYFLKSIYYFDNALEYLNDAIPIKMHWGHKECVRQVKMLAKGPQKG